MKTTHKTGLWATGGAVLSAIASSACCWLPLSLLAFGMSAGGVAMWFEQYRVIFLFVSGAFLMLGFYVVYVRAPRCEPGSACATSNRRSARYSKAMLWMSTVVVIAFAAFPKYIGTVLTWADASSNLSTAQPISANTSDNAVDSQIPSMESASADSRRGSAHASNGAIADSGMIIEIQGMTCQGCAVNLEHSLARLPGVGTAQVWFKEGYAHITSKAGSSFDPQLALKTIDDAGFHASIKQADEDH